MVDRDRITAQRIGIAGDDGTIPRALAGGTAPIIGGIRYKRAAPFSGFRHGRAPMSKTPRAVRRMEAASLSHSLSTKLKDIPVPRMIFVNLPVGDLDASMDFYKSIGFENNPHFTDATAACMVWSEAIHVMLLTHAKWRTFTNRPIPPPGSSEVMLAISLPGREAVDVMSEAAAANGGTADINPAQDLGFLYSRSLADPDGHVWEALWMDPAAIPSGDQPG